jgi:hypothetical protein
MLKPVVNFSDLENGTKIISPIDNEVTDYLVDKEGEQYLGSARSIYPIFQFRESDFYIYTGDKKTGEVDTDFFKGEEVPTC